MLPRVQNAQSKGGKRIAKMATAAPGETASNKKRSREGAVSIGADPAGDEDLDLDLSSDIKGILAALRQVREKARTDGQKRNEEIINSVSTEVKSLVDEAKLKAEKERQSFIKAATKIGKECEASLKAEAVKYQTIYEKFCKDRDLHHQAYEDTFSKFEEAKENMVTRYDQQRKKDKASFGDLQRICLEKITGAEELIKKKKQEEKSFSMLRKTLGSLLDDDD